MCYEVEKEKKKSDPENQTLSLCLSVDLLHFNLVLSPFDVRRLPAWCYFLPPAVNTNTANLILSSASTSLITNLYFLSYNV